MVFHRKTFKSFLILNLCKTIRIVSKQELIQLNEQNNVEENKKKLRTGYTTGSSATAAAKAALLSIINQQELNNIEIRLPKGNFIKIPVHSCKFQSDKARVFCN